MADGGVDDGDGDGDGDGDDSDGVVDWQVFIRTLGIQRKCRVQKDYMITPYIMGNWFIF